MKRETVMLDGTWSVVFDESDVGVEKQYFRRLPPGKPVPVPGVWEEVRPGYDGVGWYGTTFVAPAAWLKRCVRLRFGAVNYLCEVYVNGARVGRHEGGYTPFEFDVTGRLVEGENALVVRVINPPRRKFIEGLRTGQPLCQSDIPTWKAGWYYNFGGIWQSVQLIVTDRVYVKDVFVEPLPDRKTARVHVTVAGRKGVAAEVAVAVRPWKGREETGGEASAAVRLRGRETTVTVPVKISAMRLWDTEDPFLYVASARVESAGGADELSARFGMRTFTVKGSHFYLNGRRVVLKGFLQQGAYPRKLAFPQSREMIRDELNLVKKNGFNFVRLHLKPDPHGLDLMDEMGILACGEPPLGWIARSPQITRRCLSEVEGLITRDRNHPSVVFWSLLNETYHYRSFTWQQMDRLRRAISHRARDLDPTRIIGDNSGGGARYGENAGAMMPYKRTYSPMRDLHQYCPMPVQEDALEQRYRNLPKKGGPIYISEFGAFECPPDYERTLARYSAADRKIGLEDYGQYRSFYESLKEQFQAAGLRDLFGDVGNFIRLADERCREDIRAIVGAIRVNPHLGGYAICQLADASGEIFGVTDIWRQPKRHFKDYVAASQTPLIVPHFRRRVVEPGDSLELDVSCLNEHLTGSSYVAEVALRELAGGRTVGRLSKSFKAAGWVQTVLRSEIAAPRRPGRYVAEAVLKEKGRIRSTNSLRFTVVEQPDASGIPVRVLDSNDEVAEALAAVGVASSRSTNNTFHKNRAFFIHGRVCDGGRTPEEGLKQISRQVRLGGVAVVLEPSTPLFYDALLPWTIRMTVPMRNMFYVRPHPILEGLPSGGFAEYEYSHLPRGGRHQGADVSKVGGRTIIGGIGAHMWTRPDEYRWSSLLDDIPLGRGRIILVQLELMRNLGKDPVARRLLRNLVRYAHESIKPGLEDRSVGRCMDPITPPD